MELYLVIAALVVGIVCLVLLILLLLRQKGLDPVRLSDAVADEVTQREAIALNAVKTDLINEGRANRVESTAQVNSSMKTWSVCAKRPGMRSLLWARGRQQPFCPSKGRKPWAVIPGGWRKPTVWAYAWCL